MKYMLIHCIDESAWSDPATPRPGMARIWVTGPALTGA